MDFERVQFEKDMKDFSAGQKKKVLIAKSLCEPAHLYVWDEPLNYIRCVFKNPDRAADQAVFSCNASRGA